MKIFLFFFLGYLVSFSQSKYSNDFLSIGIHSRSISMSNTVVSNVSDLTSVFYNPAGLNNVKGFELGVMHSSYFAGIAEYDYAGIAMPVDSNYVLGVAFIRFGIDDIDIGISKNSLDIDAVSLTLYETRPQGEDIFIDSLLGIGSFNTDIVNAVGSS